MLPEEVPEKDLEIVLDFDTVYNFIYMQEKEMRGEEIESPEWDRQPRNPSKQIQNTAKEGLHVMKILNSADIGPKDAKKDFDKLVKHIFRMMMQEGEGPSDDFREKDEKEFGNSQENFETSNEK